MIKEKIVYVTEDGIEFSSKESAQQHLKFIKFERNLIVLLGGKDLTASNENLLLEFIVENNKELFSMLLDLNKELL